MGLLFCHATCCWVSLWRAETTRRLELAGVWQFPFFLFRLLDGAVHGVFDVG